MRASNGPRRYVLLPSRDSAEPRAGEPGRPRVRRYSLARVAVSPRSALGGDWHRRMEDVADRGP